MNSVETAATSTDDDDADDVVEDDDDGDNGNDEDENDEASKWEHTKQHRNTFHHPHTQSGGKMFRKIFWIRSMELLCALEANQHKPTKWNEWTNQRKWNFHFLRLPF